MNIWQKKEVELVEIIFYHYIVYIHVPNNYFLKPIFLKILTTHINHNLKDGCFFCISIKSPQNSFLKHVLNDVYDFFSRKRDLFPRKEWYEMTLDLFEWRIYNPPASKIIKAKPRNLIKLHFVNKSMGMINIS